MKKKTKAPGTPSRAKLITTTKAAALLGLSPSTVLRAVRDGQFGVHFQTPGGHHRLSVEAVEAFRAKLGGAA